jgi:hypothetical protein
MRSRCRRVGGGSTGAGLPSTIVTKTSAYTAASGDFVEADTSTVGFTVTLPSAPAVGALVAVKKISADTNTLTIAPAAGGTIDGDANATTVTQWAGAVFEHKASNVWRIAAVMSSTGAAGPTGPRANTGAAATVAVGTVTTGTAGGSATVTNSGTATAAVLDFTIPRGASGTVSAPLTLTGSSDAIQLGVVGNATQTSDFMQVKTSGGTLVMRVEPGANSVGVLALQTAGINFKANNTGAATTNREWLVQAQSSPVQWQIVEAGVAERFRISAGGDIGLNMGGAALATNATLGFTHLPNTAGTPTGTPARSYTGATPVVIDTTGSKLWAYIGGGVEVGGARVTTEQLVALVAHLADLAAENTRLRAREAELQQQLAAALTSEGN